MEEKNLVVLPEEVVNYLDYMKENNYTLKGALNVVIGEGKTKKFMDNYLEYGKNQEKVALAWVNGYKRKEKIYFVKLKNINEIGDCGYLNYNKHEKKFAISSKEESTTYKTKFTKEFLKENSFGWVIDCEGVELIEVKE